MNYNKVKIYSTRTCPYCILAANWLTEKKVNFEKIMVDQNQDEARIMVEKTGQMGVPVIEIEYPDRKPEFIIGFNQPLLSYMLGV